jgi:type IX secretion system PorP/SprF family membrane protein
MIKMNSKYSLITILLSLLFVSNIKAQDFHLSQYDAAPLYLNPALVGQFDGKFRAHGHYRTQWGSVSSKPFNTAAISFDMPYKKFAFGAQILNYRAGAGNYDALGITLNGGYSRTVDKNKFHKISIGVQLGVIQKSIDFSKLYFESQYTTVDGGTFDQSLPTGETFGSSSFWLPDLNAGFVYYYGEDQKKVNPFIGASVFHLTQPKESFYGIENKLPMRLMVHAGAKVNLSERIQLLPKLLFMQQKNAQEINYGLMLHYHLKGSGAILLLQPTYRSADAFIIEGGVKYGNYEVRLGYDYNTSTLNDFSDGKGGFEISLTYIPKMFKPNPVNNCPRI